MMRQAVSRRLCRTVARPLVSAVPAVIAAFLGVVQAAVPAPEAPSPAQEPSGGARWSAQPGAGRAGFVLHTFWHDVEGTTTSLTADLTSASGDVLSDGEVSVSVEAGALETGIARRDRKMRDEHLEVVKYPRIEFRSTGPPRRTADPETPEPGTAGGPGRSGAAEGGAGVFHLVVEGDLTIHGVSRRVEAPIEARALPDGWQMKGALIVRLTEYGVPDPSVVLNKVRDEVDVRFEIRLRRADAGAGGRGRSRADPTQRSMRGER